jgi:hypothetical protein
LRNDDPFVNLFLFRPLETKRWPCEERRPFEGCKRKLKIYHNASRALSSNKLPSRAASKHANLESRRSFKFGIAAPISKR